MKLIFRVSWIPALILIILVSCTGCTSQPETTNTAAIITETPMTIPSATPTLIPRTTTIPTPIIITIPTATPVPVYTAIEPEWTQPPTVYAPAEKDITKINFTKYTGKEFMAEYPVTWTVADEMFTVADRTYNGKDLLKSEAKKTSFISEDAKTRLVVIVYDLAASGRQYYTPTIDNARRTVTRTYPGVVGDTAISNFRYSYTNQNILMVSYDVVLHASSYTDESFITYNHLFELQFMVTNSTLDEYRDLKYRMTNSVVTEGMQTGTWW